VVQHTHQAGKDDGRSVVDERVDRKVRWCNLGSFGSRDYRLAFTRYSFAYSGIVH